MEVHEGGLLYTRHLGGREQKYGRQVPPILDKYSQQDHDGVVQYPPTWIHVNQEQAIYVWK